MLAINQLLLVLEVKGKGTFDVQYYDVADQMVNRRPEAKLVLEEIAEPSCRDAVAGDGNPLTFQDMECYLAVCVIDLSNQLVDPCSDLSSFLKLPVARCLCCRQAMHNAPPLELICPLLGKINSRKEPVFADFSLVCSPVPSWFPLRQGENLLWIFV